MAAKGQGDTFIAQGVGGQLVVTPTKVIIQRKGFLGASMQRGDKEIRIDQISAIQLKKPGLTRGFIRLSFVGGQESTGGGALGAAYDENAILIGGSQYKNFVRAKELIEQYQAAMRTAPVQTMTPPAPAVSSADEIEKLAALRARGLLTEEGNWSSRGLCCLIDW